ncbi:hypothetical protein [Burkholderia stagnalis]|uniref:hypothetical protein n=1 Tax=Burkholderia stagnalis TaxID=1503054 RepID=UPI000F801E86|nr:hypothetical protein [Burkholderia stagnalis]
MENLETNKSFRSDFESAHKNAVVSGRWLDDRDSAVREGFMQATLALLAVAESGSYVVPDTDEYGYVSIDALVYPICFNARHFIELFLKDSILAASALNKKITQTKPTPTHELTDLWKIFDTIIARDNRLAASGLLLKEVFLEVAEVDDTSMTFRYPYDLKGNAHLSNIIHINLGVLGRRLREVFNQADEFTYLLKELQHEYAQNTFTEKLHRENIETIARQLPTHDKWAEDLEPIKKQICSEFALSSNDFGKAIKLIKHHREFSALIGLELPLDGLPADVFARLARVYAGEAAHYIITKDEWLRLEAVMAIGYSSSYSEEYDSYLKENSNRDFGDPYHFHPEDIAKRACENDQLLRCGLLTLGQHTLLAALAEALPHLSEPLKNMPRDIRSEKMKKLYTNMMRPNPCFKAI